jgi:hypothetical protein
MKAEVIVKEYVKRISDEDLSFLGVRFKQNLCGDGVEIANKLAEDFEIDDWLSTSCSGEEWFEMIDLIADYVKSEYSRRVDDGDSKRRKRKD